MTYNVFSGTLNPTHFTSLRTRPDIPEPANRSPTSLVHIKFHYTGPTQPDAKNMVVFLLTM